jgi:hypothetical protein
VGKMTRIKYKCDRCKKMYNAKNMLKVKEQGFVCFKCRQQLGYYDIGYRVPRDIARIFGFKSKKMGEITKNKQ